MSIKTQFLKRKPVCKVTFRIPEEIGNSVKTAHVVGEFNNWNFSSTPMKKLKTGVFTTTLDPEKEREYQFRYLWIKRIGKMIEMLTSLYPLHMVIVRIQLLSFKPPTN